MTAQQPTAQQQSTTSQQMVQRQSQQSQQLNQQQHFRGPASTQQSNVSNQQMQQSCSGFVVQQKPPTYEEITSSITSTHGTSNRNKTAASFDNPQQMVPKVQNATTNRMLVPTGAKLAVQQNQLNDASAPSAVNKFGFF
jgi:hypothetical protein